jgi:hypothetical protein
MQTLTDRQIASLLELDPDLGQLLDGERLAAARRELHVAIRTLQLGAWDTKRMGGASPEHIGLLVLDGVIAREVLVSDIVSTELLGRGDVVRPWRIENGDALLEHTVRWTVLSRTTAALLDRRFAAECGRYPEIGAAIFDRMNERAQRLAVTQAISQLNRVDRRLLAFFWHLAERWGRITPEGVALPLTLSHRMLGQLVGARRPTVSTALTELAKQEQLHRRDDGSWLLTGEPVGLPRPEGDRAIPIRRRLLPAASATAPGIVEQHHPAAVAEASDGRGDELRRTLRRVRDQFETNTGVMQQVMVLTTQLTAHNAQLRDRCRVTRQRGHDGDAAVRVR